MIRNLLKPLLAITTLAFALPAHAQTVFTDDYNRATLSPGGTPSVTYSATTTANISAAIASSTYLNVGSGGTTPTPGISYVTGATSSFSAPYNTTLSSCSGLITWTFNFRYNRTSNPAPPASGSYGVAVVLAGSGTNIATTGSGYAIIYGSTSTPDPVRLVSYSNGITGTTTITNICSSGALDLAAVNNYASVRVTYDPSNNNWSLYVRDDGASGWSDPSVGVTAQKGTTTANSTYTGSALGTFGYLWTYSNATNTGVLFDNFSVNIASSCTAPTNQATALTATNAATSGFNASWTAGSGSSGTIAVVRPTASAITAPVSGNTYTANADWTQASQIDANNRVVFRNAGNSISGITGLNAETQYTITAYDYNSTGNCYNLTTPASTSIYTLSNEPAAQATSFSANASAYNQVDLTFSDAGSITNADGYIILQKMGSAPTGLPADGQSYTVGATVGDATVAAIVNNTTNTTATINGLSASTNYYFELIPFNANVAQTAQTYNYYTGGTIQTTNATTPSGVSAFSDIADNGGAGFYTANIDYTQWQSATINSIGTGAGTGVAVFNMNLRDGGATAPDADALPTILSDISFSYSGAANSVRSAALFTGTTKIADGLVTANGISFSGLSGSSVTATDDATQPLTLAVTFNSTVTDNDKLVFSVASAATASAATSSQFTAANAGGTQSDAAANNNNRIAVTATQLVYATQPSNVVFNTNISPAVVVKAEDANSNVDLDYNGSGNAVTMSVTGSAFTGAAVTMVNPANGVATFSNLQFSTTATGATLTATGAGTPVVPAAGSNAFNVTNTVYTATWDFTTATSSSAAIPNLTISTITQGNNNGTTTFLSATSGSTGAYTNASGGNNGALAALTGAMNNGSSAYVQFTLTPASGYSVTLAGIAFGSRSTSTGPAAYTLRSSLDGYVSDIVTGSLSATSTWAYNTSSAFSVSGAVSSPVTFRLYGHSGTGSGTAGTANWRVDDVNLSIFMNAAAACTTPSAPAGVTFNSVTTTGLSGTIDNGANPAPSGYLVVRYTGSTAPSAPADGTTYSSANIATLNPGGVADLQFIQSSTATTFSETGLTAGTTYKYNVYAYNNTACTGGPKYSAVVTGSQATNALAPCTAPATQATSLVFSAISNTGLTGTISGATADGYLVIRASGAAPTQPADGTVYNAGNIAALGSGLTYISGSASSFTETSLTGNTNYTYYVFAYNNTGCSGGPAYNTATPLSASQYTYPDTATSLVGANVAGSSFDAQWTAPATSATGYYLDVSFNNTFTSMVSGYNNLNIGNVTTYTVSGIPGGSTYFFRVRAYNAAGTGPNSAVSAMITTACAAPTAVATNLSVTNVTNTTFKINWSNTGNGSKRIVKINTVNSFSVTDGVEPSGNAAYSGGEQTVYNGTGTSVTINGLAQNTTYYIAIYEASCTGTNILYNMSPLTGSQATTNLQATVLVPGDVAVVGCDANGTSCGGSSRDQIWIVSFKDINPGTSFDLTDNGWQRMNANQFGNSEGIYRYTYTGTATIPAGSIMRVIVDNIGNVQTAMNTLYGAGSWTVSQLGGNSNSVALNNTGDQFYIMQGGTWNNGSGSQDATYTGGNILYGFSTTNWAAFTGLDLGTQASTLHTGVTCLNIAPQISGNGVTWLTYNGPVTATDQRGWLVRFKDAANWTSQASCTATDAAMMATFGGTTGSNYGTISINAGSLTAGKWSGETSASWSDCSNWENLVVPDTTTDVIIPSAPANQPTAGTAVYAHDLTVQSGATLTVGTGGSLNVKGNLVNNGTLSTTLGSMTLNGAVAQTITGLNADNVIVNNANGITLASDAAVSNTLTMTNGNINTGIYTLTLGSSTAQPGTLNYTSGLISGKMQRWFATATNSGNSSSLFPMGTTGNNRSVLVEYGTAPTSGGTLTAQLVNAQMGSNISVAGNIVSACAGAGGFAVTHTANGYWQIDAGNGLAGGNYDITLAAQGVNGINSNCELTLLKRDQPGAWQESGTHVEPFSANSILYLKRSNAAGWSDWGIGGSNISPLAVKLSSFNAAKQQNSVAVGWTTESELSSDRFELERSENGKDYMVLTAVKANGHASAYSYIDAKPAAGKNYYRLVMIEANGKKQYSSVRVVDMGNNNTFTVVAYPNPVSDRLTVQAVNKTAAATLQLTDLTGKVLAIVQMNGDAVDVDMSSVANGVYLVRYADGTHTELFKIVK